MPLFDRADDQERKEIKEKKVVPSQKPKVSSAFYNKKRGVVSTIIKGVKIIVDVNGNGEVVKYDEKEHGGLKVGDPIDF
jgi:hypothetical protein